MSRLYLTVEQALAIHDDQIAEIGGESGLLNPDALESALYRPQIGYYDDLLDEAAALMESLAMNHPFVDGNKRVAFFGTDAFLRMNGSFIDADNEEAHAFFMHLFETGTFRFRELRAWLGEHAVPMPEG